MEFCFFCFVNFLVHLVLALLAVVSGILVLSVPYHGQCDFVCESYARNDCVIDVFADVGSGWGTCLRPRLRMIIRAHRSGPGLRAIPSNNICNISRSARGVDHARRIDERRFIHADYYLVRLLIQMHFLQSHRLPLEVILRIGGDRIFPIPRIRLICLVRPTRRTRQISIRFDCLVLYENTTAQILINIAIYGAAARKHITHHNCFDYRWWSFFFLRFDYLLDAFVLIFFGLLHDEAVHAGGALLE